MGNMFLGANFFFFFLKFFFFTVTKWSYKRY